MIAEGELLWTPDLARIRKTHLIGFMDWLARNKKKSFSEYDDLWQWSVDDLDGFWSALWEYFSILHDGDATQVRTGRSMEAMRWFPDARTNYAEHLLRHEVTAAADEIALKCVAEERPLSEVSWHSLGNQVRSMATALRDLGIRPGDRIVSYMPNVPETLVAMLGTVAIGAVWSAASPEFGAKTVIDRFSQISPRLIFAANGYRFAGKQFNRTKEIAQILEAIPSIETVIWLPYVDGPMPHFNVDTSSWADIANKEAPSREAFRFERVACDHPLWILFSSGTTGLPKAITHSHVGIVLDQLKQMALHFDLAPGKSMFFYTTTGWMMWNAVISALFTGAGAVLYDGSPTWPQQDRLWEIAAQTRATMVGASPTLVAMLEKSGFCPKKDHDLSEVDAVVLGGAPSTPATFAWLYANVKSDLWVINTSGGTDLCGGLVGPVPTRPVRAGQMQGRLLGIAAEAWSDGGQSLVGEVGELVVTRSFPSIPLYFWGDTGGERMHDTYFAHFPGVWRHGDFVKITPEGGAYVYGRADATLNRFGVRIGTSEIYEVVANVEGVSDALVVCCETGDGGFFMPLFVMSANGQDVEDSLVSQIKNELREKTSPRHVPDAIFGVPIIPYTLTGKKMEVPIRKIIMGADANSVSTRDSIVKPESLDWFIDFARRPEVRQLFAPKQDE